MNDKLFDSPVFVKGGSFTIVEIASLRDAIDFLDEWPVELQDVPYDAIRRACYSALDGAHPLSRARQFRQMGKSCEHSGGPPNRTGVDDRTKIWPRRRAGLRKPAQGPVSCRFATTA